MIASLRLDQERESRKSLVVGAFAGSSLDGQVREGATIARIRRSGGAFDPEGCRACDVRRCADLVAVVDALRGRWVLVTLTIDRTLFAGPEAAYQRGNEYVRKAISGACPKGIWFAAFEVQGKTGDGWPHWHVMAWCPDQRREFEVKADVERGWRTRSERVDKETGEVSRSSERIGFVDVEAVRDRRGAGIYIAKYLMKSWSAVPPWMLASTRRFRKMRLSTRMYEVLARLYRHDPVIRKTRTAAKDDEKPHRHRWALRERMARSGSAVELFDVGPFGTLEYVGSAPIPRDRLLGLVESGSLRVVRLGAFKRMIFEVSRGLLAMTRDERVRRKWRVESRRYENEQAAQIESAWNEHQRRREQGWDGIG